MQNKLIVIFLILSGFVFSLIQCKNSTNLSSSNNHFLKMTHQENDLLNKIPREATGTIYYCNLESMNANHDFTALWTAKIPVSTAV